MCVRAALNRSCFTRRPGIAYACRIGDVERSGRLIAPNRLHLLIHFEAVARGTPCRLPRGRQGGCGSVQSGGVGHRVRGARQYVEMRRSLHAVLRTNLHGERSLAGTNQTICSSRCARRERGKLRWKRSEGRAPGAGFRLMPQGAIPPSAGLWPGLREPRRLATLGAPGATTCTPRQGRRVR